MNFIIYIIPFFVAIILFLFFRRKVVWWEYVVLIIPSLLFSLLIKLCIVSYNVSDTEYLGGYVTKIIYYEEWDEMVLRTKTRRVPCGRDSNGHTQYRTETYTVWERDYHPEKWVYVNNENNFEHIISKKLYNKIKFRLNSPAVFKDMKRNYHRIDGDAYVTMYDGSIEHLYDITWSHKYKNKVQASQSNTIFKMLDIDKEMADSLGLYEYPEITDLAQNPILGRNVSKEEIQIFRYINAMKGKKNQFRTYVLFFKHDEFDKSELQKSYWQNGNKNEFIVCLGMKGDSVVWTNSFSWCDMPKLEVKTRSYFIDNPKLDLKKYGTWLNNNIDDNWVRKEFEDFKYIDIELSTGQYIALFFLTIVFNIGVGIAVICNNINYED